MFCSTYATDGWCLFMCTYVYVHEPWQYAGLSYLMQMRHLTRKHYKVGPVFTHIVYKHHTVDQTGEQLYCDRSGIFVLFHRAFEHTF